MMLIAPVSVIADGPADAIPAQTDGDVATVPSAAVLAVGDSVMLGAAPALGCLINGIDIDAVVGRQVATGVGILRARAAAGQLPGIVIVDLGTNGLMTSQQFDDIMTILSGARRVVFVNIRAPRAWEAPNNAILADGASRYPNVELVDWYAATAGHPELLWDDGIHLTPAGAEAYAELVAPVATAPLIPLQATQ
jgi:lysophospholipase L1-like esterase